MHDPLDYLKFSSPLQGRCTVCSNLVKADGPAEVEELHVAHFNARHSSAHFENVDTTLFESKPRWPGAPLVCLRVNLLAFKTEKELSSYMDRFAPGASIKRKGVCKICHHWHAKT